MNEGKGSSAATAVIVAILGLAIGFGGAKLIDHNKDNSNSGTTTASTQSSMKASDLRATLVTLGVQHMDLTDQAIDSALDGSTDADAMKAALIKNGQDISGAIGSVYGDAAQKQFQDLWNTHLNDFVKYAVAAKTGDAAGKQAALTDIDTNYTKPIAKLLSGANPNLPQATLETAFGDHVTMTAGVIDDHVAGDYTKEASDQAMAVTHIQGLMSTLAGAIAKQYPDKF